MTKERMAEAREWGLRIEVYREWRFGNGVLTDNEGGSLALPLHAAG